MRERTPTWRRCLAAGSALVGGALAGCTGRSTPATDPTATGSTGDYTVAMEPMGEDPVGKRLRAVRNDRLYRGGTSYQGPIINLLQTEAAAEQFYPDTFGEWRGLETLSNPDERLFDYQQVADIVGE